MSALFRRKRGTSLFGEVQGAERVSASMLRVILWGGTLDQFEPTEFTDQYINASFLPAESPLEVPFEESDARELGAELQPRPRRFTVRRWNQEKQTLSIDFMTHGDAGYAGSWAQRVQPGDRLQFKGPGGSYRPSPDVDWHLLAGDESALGAIGASLESLNAQSRALVFVVVDGPDHQLDLPSSADVSVKWLHRSGAENPETLLAEAIRGATFPSGTYDVFVHGEAAEVRAARDHLVADRGIDRKAASISPYWRRGHTDEEWRAVKREWMKR